MPSETQLSRVLSDFARTMLTDFPIQAILDALVGRIVDVLPITAAGVTLISPSEDPHYVAASDESAMRFEELQTELVEGPCLVAYHTGQPVSVADLRVETRFPRFSARAIEEGLGAVFTFPLRDGEDQLGALDLYRSTPGPLNDAAMDAAQTLADVASAYLINATARSDLSDAFDQSVHRSLHDPLTGLPNRVLLLDRLDQALARRERQPSSTAVFFIDIDRFKLLNDSLGHRNGDRLLIEIARRLDSGRRPGDTVARYGGDEFVMLCDDLDDGLDAAALARRLAVAVEVPISLDGTDHIPTVSIGIAFASPTGPTTAVALLHDADVAMYRAKAGGRGRFEIFDTEVGDRAGGSHRAEADLRRAIDHGELSVVYQPEIDLQTDQVSGVEALVRWDHPQRGRLLPAEFIPLAEATGLVVPLGAFVLQEACREVATWSGDTPQLDVSLSVNLSARQLVDPELVSVVRRALAESGLDPSMLCLEITESVLLDNTESTIQVLDALKAIGVRIGVDDFGTGYASLTYLKQFPVDTIKIDKSFTHGVVDDPKDRAIIANIVDLANAFGLSLVAEGIETLDQLTLVSALGASTAQGFLWSQPLPPDELKSWMKTASFTPLRRADALENFATRVMIVDADPAQRTAVRAMFVATNRYAIVGEADDGREAIPLAARAQPDLVLLDLSSHDHAGLDALPGILAVSPHTKVVVVTALDSQATAISARALGAAGCFDKREDATRLLDYLAEVL